MTVTPRISNFHQVNDWLFRGGQPDATGIQELSNLGVKSVISLKHNLGAEKDWCEQFGIGYTHLPIDYHGPSDSTVCQFLNLLRSEPKKIFVHCQEGKDRTGLMIAIFQVRMAEPKLSFDQAYAEMKNYGYGELHHLLFPQIKNTLRYWSDSTPRCDFESADSSGVAGSQSI